MHVLCFFFQFIKSREGIFGIQDFFLCSDCMCFSACAFPRARLSPLEVPELGSGGMHGRSWHGRDLCP